MSAADFAGYEVLVAELRANPPAAPESVRERVLAAGPGRRRPARRRLVLVVVPLALAAAVAAAFVHGFVNSGSPQRAMLPNLAAGKASTPAIAKHTDHLLSPATTVAAAGSAHYAPVPQAQRDIVTIPHNRLVHADASLQVQVHDRAALSKATNRATQVVASLGGYAQSVHYESSRQGYGNAFLALRVPLGRAQAAIARLGSLGRLVSQQISTQDLQHQLTRQTNQIGSLRRAIAVYEQALQSGTLSAPQRVEIQIRLENAQHSLVQLRKARSGTVAYGATADISLTLTTNKSSVIIAPHRSGRFGRLLGSAGHFLALEGIIILYALIVVGPLLLLGGLAWWILRERRRRGERRLLASA